MPRLLNFGAVTGARHEKKSAPKLRGGLIFYRKTSGESLIVAVVHIQFAVGDARGDDEPYRRERDERVHDDGESAARATENRHEVEIEEAEQAPVQRAEKYKNVSDNVCNFHSF